jgi:hypothetical protein
MRRGICKLAAVACCGRSARVLVGIEQERHSTEEVVTVGGVVGDDGVLGQCRLATSLERGGGECEALCGVFVS